MTVQRSTKPKSTVNTINQFSSCSGEVAKLLERIESKTEITANLLTTIDTRTELHTNLLNDIKTNLTYLSVIAENTGNMAKTMETFRNDTKDTITNFREDNKPLIKLVNNKSVPLSVFIMAIFVVSLISLVGVAAITEMNVHADKGSVDIQSGNAKVEKYLSDQEKEALNKLLNRSAL